MGLRTMLLLLQQGSRESICPDGCPLQNIDSFSEMEDKGYLHPCTRKWTTSIGKHFDSIWSDWFPKSFSYPSSFHPPTTKPTRPLIGTRLGGVGAWLVACGFMCCGYDDDSKWVRNCKYGLFTDPPIELKRDIGAVTYNMRGAMDSQPVTA